MKTNQHNANFFDKYIKKTRFDYSPEFWNNEILMYKIFDREGYVPIMTIIMNQLERRDAHEWCRVLNEEDHHYLIEVYQYLK